MALKRLTAADRAYISREAKKSAPCRASTQIGCPDDPAKLVCHQPSPHPGLNHYDAQERIWWARTDAEPVLWHEQARKEKGKGK